MIKTPHNKLHSLLGRPRGSALLFALIFGSVAFTIIVLGVSGYAMMESRASNRVYERDLAFHIAEAGISYYRWHLAHNHNDYTDGTNQPGPYIHEYKDKDGNTIGYYSLSIDPPLVGSTVATIRSTGWTVVQPQTRRTIQVRIGSPALTNYAFLENADMSFSFTTVVHGEVYSNGSIRFDATTDSWVKAHVDIWGSGGPKSFWVEGVPVIDFYSISGDLKDIMDIADEAGEGGHLLSSGNEGWHIVFHGSQYDLYRVTARDCYKGAGRWKGKHSSRYWDGDTYCYDIKTQTQVSLNNPLPASGVIFSEDDTWVDGVIDGRVTLGVGKIPVQGDYKNIYINGNLTYVQKSSDDVIGLMAQGDIIVPYEVPTNLEINAAALSQFGKIYTPYYNENENPNALKNSLTFFGSQISYSGGGWKYCTSSETCWGHYDSGFLNTNHSYDGNLKYYPPPGFPVGQTYELVSWEELQGN